MEQNKNRYPNANRWTLTLGTVAGIPIRVHATFLLLLLWIGGSGSSVTAIIVQASILLGIFGCVLLHELGHATVAKRYEIATRDITLYPFGGIASLMGSSTPKGEFWIAIAGPAVNTCIGLLLWGIERYIALPDIPYLLIDQLAHANFFLALFNLIPALPMDGGRILRALLEIGDVRGATLVASRLSQIICVLLGIYSLYIGNPILTVIAAFIFMSAMREILNEKAKLGARGRTVKDAMLERGKLQFLSHGMTISEAVTVVLKSLQPIFPVLLGEQILGLVEREVIVQNAATQEEEQYISGLMKREFTEISSNQPIDELVRLFEANDRDVVVVRDDGRFMGLVFREKLFEFLFIHGLRQEKLERELDSQLEQR